MSEPPCIGPSFGAVPMFPSEALLGVILRRFL